MIVTSIHLRIFPVGRRRVRAVGSIVLDQCFQIEHIHVVEREDGTLLVAMPSRYEFGRYHDVAHPITSEFRSAINRAVLEEYTKGLTQTSVSAKVSP